MRWDSENSPRRYVYYPAKAIVYDTANPPATSVWTFLKSRGWSRDQLKEAFGLARGDLLRLAAAPADRRPLDAANPERCSAQDVGVGHSAPRLCRSERANPASLPVSCHSCPSGPSPAHPSGRDAVRHATARKKALASVDDMLPN